MSFGMNGAIHFPILAFPPMYDIIIYLKGFFIFGSWTELNWGFLGDLKKYLYHNLGGILFLILSSSAMYRKYSQKYWKKEIISIYFCMGCSDCKKKKKIENLKTQKKRIIETDRVITWVIVAWFFLGFYGLWSLIEKIFHLWKNGNIS